MPTRSARVLVAALFAVLFLSFYGVAKAIPAADVGAVGVELPDVGLEGVNDPACRSDTRTRPVVLVHGTFGTAAAHFTGLAAVIRKQGYCVFALDYGDEGRARVAASAKELAGFVDDVLLATGADRVDIVGYSQGGMMPRQYMRFEGGADLVNALIGIAPSNHGTGAGILPGTSVQVAGVDEVGVDDGVDVVDDVVQAQEDGTGADSGSSGDSGSSADTSNGNGNGTSNGTGNGGGILDCLSCLDQIAGSSFMDQLNDGGDLIGEVRYTTIATRFDLVVLPYTSQALNGPPDRVTNLVLQELCPGNRASHTGIRNDPVTAQLVLHALERDGLADPAFRPECSPRV